MMRPIQGVMRLVLLCREPVSPVPSGLFLACAPGLYLEEEASFLCCVGGKGWAEFSLGAHSLRLAPGTWIPGSEEKSKPHHGAGMAIARLFWA